MEQLDFLRVLVVATYIASGAVIVLGVRRDRAAAKARSEREERGTDEQEAEASQRGG